MDPDIQIRRDMTISNGPRISGERETESSTSTPVESHMFSFLNSGVQRKHLVYFPKKVFKWIYSFSLILLILLALAFIAVTPIDVIVQTSSKSSSAIKMFIVIIGHVLYLVLAIFIYLLRVYQSRVSFNDIPTNSVYLPQKDDLPLSAFKAIEKKFEECMEIKVKAGPLYYPNTIIKHPGASPPEYIQKRYNHDDGLIFPPEECYEDIIRSIGDKLSMGSQFFSQVKFPSNYSLKEIIYYLFNMHIKKGLNTHKDGIPNISRMVTLYEKFKFGPDLIKEEELIEFISDFGRLALIFQTNFESNFEDDSTISKKEMLTSDKFLQVPRSDLRNRSLDNEFEHVLQRNLNSSFNTVTSKGSFQDSSSSSGNSLASSSEKNNSRHGSIVKRKLALAAASSDEESLHGRSGYFSDEENESIRNHFYNFGNTLYPVDTNESYSSLKYSKKS